MGARKPVGDPIKCVFLEPAFRFEHTLRRYCFSNKKPCPKRPEWGHDASVFLGIIKSKTSPGTGDDFSHDDPRWPKACAACGYVFQDEDPWQCNYDQCFGSPQDPKLLTTLSDAPTGAMWYADWFISGRTFAADDNTWRGPDGRCLVVRLPDKHDWMVDSQASNCTMPSDRKHKCWVRSGAPPKVTAGKQGFT